MAEQEQVLIAEEGYEGKYVALRSFLDRSVIASGNDPKIVMAQAHEQGINNPVLFFVPEQDATFVY